jgi:hypothetical protein
MLDIADQLLLRWERFGESAIIDVPGSDAEYARGRRSLGE